MSDTARTTPAANDGSALGLLSMLSTAAANAAPIPVSKSMEAPTAVAAPISLVGATTCGVTQAQSANASNISSSVGAGASISTGSGVKQHRRLASTGKARRRLSDARDAAARPSPAALQTTAALSLASLSLSSSPPPQCAHQPSSSISAASSAVPIPINGHTSDAPAGTSKSVPLHEPNFGTPQQLAGLVNALPILANGSGGKSGKKRGTIFTCESCSKVYRHPSCLIKHRWEHSPHWREASKFVLSKHQQVQLLEAAAILSHMAPSATGSSLPEDRSLWPAFLSGGLLPAQSATDGDAPEEMHATSKSVPASSVLTTSRAGSQGPKMHDYDVPGAASGITQLRPGLLGVPTSAVPVPVPVSESRRHADADAGGSWEAATSESYYTFSSYASVGLSAAGASGAGGGLRQGRWTLPRSSVRSVSGSERSPSEEGDDEDGFLDGDVDVETFGGRGRGRGWAWKFDEGDGRGEHPTTINGTGGGVEHPSVREDEDADVDMGGRASSASANVNGREGEEGEWDGMEMEMEMD